jgi:hypothetical protein
MPSFREAFRQGRDQARAARGAPPLARDAPPPRPPPANGEDTLPPRPPPANDEDTPPPPPPDEARNEAAGREAELQAALQKREAELEEMKGLIAGLKEYAEQLEARAAQFADVLKGPGVRLLLKRTYHSDKAARMSAADRATMDLFAARINAAYDLIKTIDKAAAEAAAQGGDEAESEE